MKRDWRYYLKKVWHFIWHDDSAIAWVVNVILAFVIIKFVLYPAAGFVLGTPLPVVAVVSSSMDHRLADGHICGIETEEKIPFWDACGNWYEARDITEEDFEKFIFPNGFWKGDVMLLVGKDPSEIEPGEVLVFHGGKKYPIIHRTIDKYEENGEWFFSTKGDHNEEPIAEYVLTDGLHFYSCYQDRGNRVEPSLCGPGVEQVNQNTPGAIKIMDETRIPEELVIGVAKGRVPLIGYIKIWFVQALSFLGLGSVAQIF